MQAHGYWLHFCRNVRYLREKNRLSLSAMAKIMHVSVKSLKRIESGDIPDRTLISVVSNLAEYFQIPGNRLFSPLEPVSE